MLEPHFEPLRTSKDPPMTPATAADPSQKRCRFLTIKGPSASFVFFSSKCPKMVSPGTPKWRPKSSNSIKMSSSRPLPKQVSKTTPKKLDFGASLGGWNVAQVRECCQISHFPHMASGSPNSLQNDPQKLSFGSHFGTKTHQNAIQEGYEKNIKNGLSPKHQNGQKVTPKGSEFFEKFCTPGPNIQNIIAKMNPGPKNRPKMFKNCPHSLPERNCKPTPLTRTTLHLSSHSTLPTPIARTVQQHLHINQCKL